MLDAVRVAGLESSFFHEISKKLFLVLWAVHFDAACRKTGVSIIYTFVAEVKVFFNLTKRGYKVEPSQINRENRTKGAESTVLATFRTFSAGFSSFGHQTFYIRLLYLMQLPVPRPLFRHRQSVVFTANVPHCLNGRPRMFRRAAEIS